MTIARRIHWQQLRVGQRVSSTNAKYSNSLGTVVAVVAVTEDGISKNVLIRWDSAPNVARLWSTCSLNVVDDAAGDLHAP
jgi:hypothetical protein